MPGDDTLDPNTELQQLTGALDAVDILREEMEQWLAEAQDASKRECLENVVAHLGAMEEEYKRRLTALRH